MGKVLILGIGGNRFVYKISAIRDVCQLINRLNVEKIPAFYFSETLLFPKKAHFR